MITEWMNKPILLNDEEDIIFQNYPLLSQEIKMERSELNGMTPFMLCCKYLPHKKNLLSKLVQLGADINLTNKKGENALGILASYGGSVLPFTRTEHSIT
jgi:hypothetical protein